MHKAKEGRTVFVEILLFALACPAMHETPSLKVDPASFGILHRRLFRIASDFQRVSIGTKITLEFRCAIKTQCFAVHEPRTTSFQTAHALITLVIFVVHYSEPWSSAWTPEIIQFVVDRANNQSNFVVHSSPISMQLSRTWYFCHDRETLIFLHFLISRGLLTNSFVQTFSM